MGCTESIGEQHLIPVLVAMLHQFPFRILGFHCDNGSEFLNHVVVKLLNKLLVEEFTRSRAYRTTDNALVEGKNGAVIRKQIGYGPIASAPATALQQFYTAYFNPYLNFHRPRGYATVATNSRGKRKRTYRHEDYRTPYEELKSLPHWEKSLKPGITPGLLQQQAQARSDTTAARRMQKAKLAPPGSLPQTVMRERREMPGLWKAWKAKGRLPTLSTSPLEISPKAGEIPTFPQRRRRGRMEKWKTKSRFSTFPPPPIPLSQTQINIGRRLPAFPVTPPGVRVRAGRFGGLSYRPPVNLGIPSESK